MLGGLYRCSQGDSGERKQGGDEGFGEEHIYLSVMCL